MVIELVIGLALFSWDNKEGSILEAKYPNNLDITNNLRNQIYQTHSYDQNFEKEELIEINYNEQIILSYCDKTKVSKAGYEILILLAEEKEKYRTFKLKAQLTELAHEIFNLSKENRRDYFLENVKVFFEKSTQKKILLLGRAGTGKTTIKKIIFEGVNPKELLFNPLEPTRGIAPSIYSWLDLNLGVFDSSGQELNFLLNDDEESSIAFDNTSIIIYVIDYPRWVSTSDEILNEIKKISDITNKKSKDAQLYLFFHKTDLINKDTRENNMDEIEIQIHKKINLPIYFTSILPDLIYLTYNAFYEMLSNFSEENFALKILLDGAIEHESKLMCFVTNRNNSIIAQTMSEDFDTTIINYSHKLIGQLNLTFEDMATNDNIDYLLLSSAKELNIVMVSLLFLENKLKNLLLISDSIPLNKLIVLIGDIKKELKNFYLYL